MIINLKSLSLLSPVFVGFFWASILFLRNLDSRRPGFYMAFLMVSIVFIFLSIVPFYDGNIGLYALMDPLFFLGLTSLFPLVYFYIRTITLRLSFTGKDWLHFVPAFIFFFLSGIFHLKLSDAERFAYAYHQEYIAGDHLPMIWMGTLNILIKTFAGLQMLIYFVLCHRTIRDYRKRINDYFSTIEKYFFRWIPFFYLTYAGSALMGIILLILGNEELNNGKDQIQIMSFFFLSAIFFTIGYIANHQRYIENGQFYTIESEPHTQHHGGDGVMLQVTKGLKERMDQYFISEKPYLDPHLKITDIARELNTNRTYISQIIRNDYKTNFNGYVNSCRVKETIRLFHDKRHHYYTIKSISETAGFNNYNSFVQAFKAETGVRPGTYREDVSVEESILNISSNYLRT